MTEDYPSLDPILDAAAELYGPELDDTPEDGAVYATFMAWCSYELSWS